MPRQVPPHISAKSDQFRAWAQDQLDGFVAHWRSQLADGDDPNYVFATFHAATEEIQAEGRGSELVATILGAAVERLARGDS